MMAREKTNAILELVSEGMMDAEATLRNVLFWMSEHEVATMVNNDVDFDGYGLSDDEDEDDEEDDDEEDDDSDTIITISGIEWDVDEDDDADDLPTVVTFTKGQILEHYDSTEVADFLSDEYGWCVNSIADISPSL